ncbi:tryptase beta-2 [Nephila pilipes]|uniref:Tryptase beta-2 n=1 Tax=Nephila pilipes TaxID=299642 RepID=A0A8X6N5A0_NEPPI|nr:tryptase beta-2 [Nephila pilipes]
MQQALDIDLKQKSSFPGGPQILREGEMKQVLPRNCMRPNLPESTINQYYCGVGTNQSSCQGDSGSSTFIKSKKKYYSLGIVSFGKSPVCHVTWPITFTKVAYFLDWIKQNVKDLPKS